MSRTLSRLTPEQRAAVVLVSLKPEQAQPLAEQLGIPAMRRIRGALKDMPFVSQEEVLAAFAEFITQLMSWRNGLRGGERESLDLLTKALGEALVEKFGDPLFMLSHPLIFGRNSASWSLALLLNMSANNTGLSRRLCSIGCLQTVFPKSLA